MNIFVFYCRLSDHVEDKSKLPILIFPEGKSFLMGIKITETFHDSSVRPIPLTPTVLPPGTCINNTSVMMFKKGSFEIGSTVYPVAIKVTWFLLVFVQQH